MPAKKNNRRTAQPRDRSLRQRTAPSFVTPMAAQVVKRLPEGNDWLYELKFDGYRALILKDQDRVEIRSRKKKDLTRMYPRVAAAALRLNARQAVVDGEIVALDANGRPSFQALQHRGSHPAHQITYYAFDLLFWAAAAYVLVRILQDGDERLWIVLGVVLGLGLLNKISVLWLGFGIGPKLWIIVACRPA